MDWETLAYSRSTGHHGQRFIRDRRPRPHKVSWTLHARLRAGERAEWTPDQLKSWFTSTEYLGRWQACEGWGDERFVAIGIREKGGHGRLVVKTFLPRAYWNFDIARYDRKMEELTEL